MEQMQYRGPSGYRKTRGYYVPVKADKEGNSNSANQEPVRSAIRTPKCRGKDGKPGELRGTISALSLLRSSRRIQDEISVF